MRTSFFLILLCAIVMAGCQQTTAPQSSHTGTVSNALRAGVYYLLQHTTMDSTGKVIEIDTTKDLIVATGVTAYGASNLAVILDSSSGGWAPDSAYFQYLPDGDVSSLVPDVISDPVVGWSTYPFATQKSATWYAVDTTESGVTTQDSEWVVGEGLANVADSLGSTPFTYMNTETITVFRNTTRSAGGIGYTESWAETYYYVPGLYYSVETNLTHYRVQGVLQPSQRTLLIATNL
jgi:hypothetical protein